MDALEVGSSSNSMLRLCQRLAFPNPIAPPPRSSVHSSSSSSKNYPFLRTSPEISRLHFAMANPSQAVSSKGPITHVIFDMDGLLLDTEKFYTEVQEIILARYNKTFDWSLKAKMMGKKAIEASRVFVEETGISDTLTAEDFLVEREAKLQSMFPTSELMPGASRLIRHLHEKGIPFALATGSHKRHFELKTQRHGELFSLMHHVVLGDDPEVKQGKPSPDIFLAAAKRFEGAPIDPKKILVFEDAPAGVLAAKNAGMSVVMVPDPRLDSCFYDIADQVLKSLLDLNPNDWGLPPFENPAS
ncbi:(DL)-glycerol-3-phosphatase 2 [Prunus avium]|uniref:glycerol-1-phosphatase n=1 Tax=Prunus avium TaxID=42229 RepID=A0A6P5S8F9_PRUAV|nr:(DL)-glycerol-3-phosphatase 2 [Prunus avium]